MGRVAEQMDLPFGAHAAPEELRRRVIDATEELLDRARARWPHAVIASPRVEFRLRGRTAGEACVTTWTTNYNAEMLERHGEEFIREIVPHEVAHVVAAALYPRRIRPHGAEWKEVMAFCGAAPRGAHGFEAVPAASAGRFAYRCACTKTHWLTGRSHRRVRRGTLEYTCRECGRKLAWAR
ncbi:MAG: SprT family zinc-dependent metalloprotease [Candidatus Eiseniibacteriota bacterium]